MSILSAPAQPRKSIFPVILEARKRVEMRKKMPRINNSGVKNLRRTQAEERQAKYDALSPAEKLAQIAERRGNSSKELARIMPQYVEATTNEPEEAAK